MSMKNTEELIGQDIEKTYVGSLVDISKEEDEGPGHAKWQFATEGEIDKDGDRFDVGSIGMEGGKGRVARFQHNNEPAGTWTLSREGTKVYANVSFYKSAAGQACREDVREMGEDCQFSFRAKVSEYYFADDVPGIAFKSVRAYETSPVYVGAGNDTKLVTIKSQEVMNMDEKEVQELEVKKEVQESTASQEAPEWAQSLIKEVNELRAEVNKEPEPTKLEIAKSSLEGLTDMEKKELGIAVPEGQADVRKVYAEVAKNGTIDDLMKAANDRQDDIMRFVKGETSKMVLNFRSEPEDILKSTLAGIGTIQSRVPAALNVANRTRALDFLPVRPVSGNSVRAPHGFGWSDSNDAGPAGAGVVNPHANVDDSTVANRDDARHNSAPAYEGTGEFMVRLVSGSATVARSDIEDDPSMVPVIVADAIRAGRQRVLTVVMRGQGGTEAVTGLNTGVTSTTAVAAGDDESVKKILSGTTKGLEFLMGGLLDTVMPNLVFASGSFYTKIYAAQKQNYFIAPGMGADGEPAMAALAHVMGVPVIINPYTAANTILMGEFSEDTYFLGMRRDIRVEMTDDGQYFRDDMMTVKVTTRIASCLRQPSAMHQVTGANNYIAER